MDFDHIDGLPDIPADKQLDVGHPLELWTDVSFQETCAHCGGPFIRGKLTGDFDESRLQIPDDSLIASFTVNVRHPVLTIYPCGHSYVRDKNQWE